MLSRHSAKTVLVVGARAYSGTSMPEIILVGPGNLSKAFCKGLSGGKELQLGPVSVVGYSDESKLESFVKLGADVTMDPMAWGAD